MNTTNISKLGELKKQIETSVPDTAGSKDIWQFIGWSEQHSEAYRIAKENGVDLREILAPMFSDVVSIVIDGAFGFPFPASAFSWAGILDGQVPDFKGKTPKQRLLSVINTTLMASLDS